MNCVCILKACCKQVNDSLANLGQFNVNSIPYLIETNHEQRNLFSTNAASDSKKARYDNQQTLNLPFVCHFLLR